MIESYQNTAIHLKLKEREELYLSVLCLFSGFGDSITAP